MRVYALASFVALGGALLACSMSDASRSAFDRGGAEEPGENAGLGGSSSGGSATDLGPTDNGVIMVHAAGLPAYRLCFQNELARRPQPDAEIMPDANVVGVEVGSAVRIAPLKGPPGKIWIFEEPLIREFSGKGSTCQVLLGNATIANTAHEIPAITTDLARGVHLLVVTGCAGKSALRSYTKAECGEDYDETNPHGNLRIVEKELKGANRVGDALPTQVVHLSQALEGARGASTLAVSFGDITTPAATHTSTATAPELFGDPRDLVAAPTFDATDEGVYAGVGFRVSLVGGDGGATSVVAEQSLADVQRLSAPREIPTTYYAAASNYVLLLLGHPAPQADDGGVDDDPLRTVHLLAVPVIEHDGDAGTDAAAGDAGEAPDGGS